MIINQDYWLLIVKIKLSYRLKLIKYQMKTFQALRVKMMYLIKLLEVEFTQIK